MMNVRDRLVSGIDSIDGLHVLGEPDMTVIAFGSDTLNVYALADVLQERKWYVERQHLPPSLHLMVSPRHKLVVEAFIEELAEATDAVRQLDATDISNMAAMYGMMGAMPDRSAARGLALEFLTQLYRA
jgi:sphinganine-1-phosphate aldolase